ncbi:uncharacterized protein ACNLHF_010474 [Anomaloglossus baeobatrachus]|uniref:uncharacterized protein LOC142280597 n=1 Tax=Anomaloglossus baeobatrachus TaxID=238106 RepID=UPI003F4F9873
MMKAVLLHVCLITGASALIHNVSAAGGETIVLPQYTNLQYTGGSLCNQIVWTFKAEGGFLQQLAKVSEYCNRQDCNETRPHCSLSGNGSLQLYGVKPGDHGQYKVTTYSVRREKSSEDTFNLQVLVLDPGAGDHTDLYTRPGSDVLLPTRYNLTTGDDPEKCDEFIWIYTGLPESALIARSKRCEMTESRGFQRISNYNISRDGHLTLIKITRNNHGNYTIGVYNSRGQRTFSHNYALYVQGVSADDEDSRRRNTLSGGFLPWSPHVFTHGAVCVLFSLLLLGLLTDLWKIKKRSKSG